MHSSSIDRPLRADPIRAGTSGVSRMERRESFADLVLRATQKNSPAASAAPSSSSPGLAVVGLGLLDVRPRSLQPFGFAPSSPAASTQASKEASKFGDSGETVAEVAPDEPALGPAPGESVTLPSPRLDKLLAFWSGLTPEIQGSLLSLPVETQTQLAGLVLTAGDNTAAFWNLLPSEIQTQFAGLSHGLKADLNHALGGPQLDQNGPTQPQSSRFAGMGDPLPPIGAPVGVQSGVPIYNPFGYEVVTITALDGSPYTFLRLWPGQIHPLADPSVTPPWMGGTPYTNTNPFPMPAGFTFSLENRFLSPHPYHATPAWEQAIRDTAARAAARYPQDPIYGSYKAWQAQRTKPIGGGGDGGQA